MEPAATSKSSARSLLQWQPLEKIDYGFAIAPLIAEVDILPKTMATLGAKSAAALQGTLINLDVGDEVYVYERLGTACNTWLRGYVVSSRGLGSNQTLPSDASTGGPLGSHSFSEAPTPNEEPHVFLGMFPASHIHVQEQLEDAELRLADIFRKAFQDRTLMSPHSTTLDAPTLSAHNLAPLPEEDESSSPLLGKSLKHRPEAGILDHDVHFTRHRESQQQESAQSDIQDVGDTRPAPPLPSLKCGDETLAGHSEPLVDEIACALREWGALLCTYISRRDYTRFREIKKRFNALHLARRQLLEQALSKDELRRLRNDCVMQLVKGNVSQGLDVIVRDVKEGEIVKASTQSQDTAPEHDLTGVRLYTLQTAHAYLKPEGEDANGLRKALSFVTLGAEVNAERPSPAAVNAHHFQPVPGGRRQHPNTVLFADKPAISGVTQILMQNTTCADWKFQIEEANLPRFFHVLLDVRTFDANPCARGETVELFFSLYSRTEARFLTEDYCVTLDDRGVKPSRVENLGNSMATLFTDLSSSDTQDLHVVCRIVRRGAMQTSTGASDGQVGLENSRRSGSRSQCEDRSSAKGNVLDLQPALRRPFGCAVLSLGQDHQFDVESTSSSARREHVMPIFVPVNEAAFSTLHQDIIASRIREFERSPHAEMIVVDVRVFYGHRSALLKKYEAASVEIPPTSRLGFPDVVLPGDRRNEVYVKLWSGQFYPSSNKMSGNTPLRNVQVSVEVRARDGKIVEGALSRGSGEYPITQFESMVFRHQNAPTWGELIKVRLPEEQIEQCHLFLSLRYRGSKESRETSLEFADSQKATQRDDTLIAPFAYGYLPLFDKKAAFIQDGSHNLFLWRSSTVDGKVTPDLYFALPPTIPEGRGLAESVSAKLAGFVQPLQDTVAIRTFLVSSIFTQNEVLLKLLHWETALHHDVQELKSVLAKFVFVAEVEIVKFLADIFDALFSIAESPCNRNGDLDSLIFRALVTVLGITQDRRFENFVATLQLYISNHFQSVGAHRYLLASMSRLLAEPARADTSKELRASIKLWPYLFRLARRSREIQRQADKSLTACNDAVVDSAEIRFKNDLDAVLKSINQLMSAANPPSIVGTQTLALQHFASVIPELATIYTPDELVDRQCAFVDSLLSDQGKIIVWKLLHIVEIVKGPLFTDDNCRAQLIPAVMRWVRPHLGSFAGASEEFRRVTESAADLAYLTWMESARISLTILALILDILQISVQLSSHTDSASRQRRQEQDNIDYVLSILPKLLETYREFESSRCVALLLRHRSAATIASDAPVIFPTGYPFPLIARRPDQWEASPSAESTPKSPVMQRFDFLHCGLGDAIAIISTLILLSPRRHLAGFFEEQADIEGTDRLKRVLNDFFYVANSMMLNQAYPRSWLSWNIFTHQMMLKVYDPIAAIMVRELIPPPDRSSHFDTILWHSCLRTLLTLLSSDQLVIESSKPQRRRAVWRLAGDIRGEGAQIFAKLWNSIGWPDEGTRQNQVDERRLNTGGFQVQFVPDLVEPILELCLSHHDELRAAAVRVLATMITSEWHLNGNFSVIEGEIIDKLDVLFISDVKGDEISRAFFIGQLRSLFETAGIEPKLKEKVMACLASVNIFLDLLISVRKLPSDEGFEDDRIAGYLKLLGFLRQAGRVAAFSTHVIRLVNVHLTNCSYVEAALTLKLHADLYTWDMDSFVEPIPELGLPRQSQFARRETLYMLVLDNLGKAQAWEISIDVCRELSQQYEFRAIDYFRLGEVLAYQASLFSKIATTQRSFPSYFAVAYWGSRWPGTLQQKIFVYRGLDRETSATFCDRIHQKYPHTKLLKTSLLPGEGVRAGDKQYLQIIPLQPEPDRSRHAFTNAEVPPIVRSYFEHNATSTFSYSRPLIPTSATQRGKKDVDITAMWTEKTVLRCQDAFPTVLRRSEVADVRTFKISPLDNALNHVQLSTERLQSLRRKYESLHSTSEGGEFNTNGLAMVLNNSIDIPANEGVLLYKSAFLSEAFAEKNKDQSTEILKLRNALDNHAKALWKCIGLHARLCPSEMKPFHATLEELFRQNYEEEVIRCELARASPSASSLDDLKDATSNAGEAPSQQRQAVTKLEEAFKPSRAAPYGPVCNPDSTGPVAARPNAHLSNEILTSTPLQRQIAYLMTQARRSRPVTSLGELFFAQRDVELPGRQDGTYKYRPDTESSRRSVSPEPGTLAEAPLPSRILHQSNGISTESDSDLQREAECALTAGDKASFKGASSGRIIFSRSADRGEGSGGRLSRLMSIRSRTK